MKKTRLLSFLILASAGILMLGQVARADDLNAQVPTADLSETSRYDRSHIDIFGNVGTESFNVDGSGGAGIHLSNSDQSSIGGRVKWQSKKWNWGLVGSYENKATKYTAPSGDQPGTVNARTQVAELALTTKPFKETFAWMEPLEFGFGWYYANRLADRAAPIDIVSDAVKSGPLFMINYVRGINENWSYRIAPEFGFYNAFREFSPTTGKYTSGYFVNSSLMLLYGLTRHLSVSAGVQVRFEQIKFYGSGERSLTDATESTLGFGVPVELSYQF